MKVEVIMPQMGESIAEGTITKWLKKIGDPIQRDEALFEISTDKVDAEIPSPAAGILVAIDHQESETVPINTVVAWIETDASEAASASASPAKKQPEASKTPPPPPSSPPPSPRGASPAAKSAPPAARDGRGESATSGSPAPPAKAPRGEEEVEVRTSPLVRKIAAEHGVDLGAISGTGLGGRVTKRDIMSFIENQPVTIRPGAGADKTEITAPVKTVPAAAPALPSAPRAPVGERIERVLMSPIRKKTAEHMVMSRRTSAHVTTVFEVDMSQVSKVREQLKDPYLRQEGVKLTFLPFIAKACIDALKAFPVVNSSVAEDAILYKKDVNLGIAVALDWGLIVPVIKHADEKNLLGLARAISDLAERARMKQLKPDEVQDGTFTITNPGVFGSLFGTPIINQPQVAILGVGAINKRALVIDDAIAIRQMVYLALSFDHRIVDGAVADQFMAHIKRFLESGETSYA